MPAFLSIARRAALALVTLAAACDQPAAPDVAAAPRVSGAEATIQWNALAQTLVDRNKPNQQAALRAFAYLTLAQHEAARAARAARIPSGADPQSATRLAIAAASAEVLRYLFPGDSTLIAGMLASAVAPEGRVLGQSLRLAGPRLDAGADAAPDALAAGRAAGGRAIDRARDDGYDAPWTGAVPNGPGLWVSALAPARPPHLPTLGQARTFYLRSGSQLRPPAPPALGTREFQAALAEVRFYSDTRSPELQRLAESWAGTTGSLVAGFWNQVADSLIARDRLSEADAAHVLAVMNGAAWDANVACHDAKYTYWLARPSTMDPEIRPAIALPNHPSYPSNHGCLSGAAAEVLGAFFPADAARLRAMADEAAFSRVVAGLHYRFDGEAGLAIGRAATRIAIEAERAADR